MPNPQFESLRLDLLRSGVAPRYVERTIVELREHYGDLESAALAAGLPVDEAAHLGNVLTPSRMSGGLKVESTRDLDVGAEVLGTLPGLPLMFCLEHRPELTRWSVALGLAAALMGGMLATLNWLIFVTPI